MAAGGGIYPGPNGRMVEIRDVWASTLDQEMEIIRELLVDYPYVAMDTEFPGVVARPITDSYSPNYHYQTLRCNVDLLKIIQLGVSFCNADGQFPPGCNCWQFNFKFNLKEDMYAQDSIDLLKESGINFQRHQDEGIDVHRFGELMMTSGLVLLDNVRWISFHSGYDFGYLVKLLTCTALPPEEPGFFDMIKTYFPTLYDVKLMMNAVDGLHGGLQRVAEDLKVERIGPMHQAGSDALLTAQTFFKLAEVSFNGIDNVHEKYCGELYGLGANTNTYTGRGPQPSGHSTHHVAHSNSSILIGNNVANSGHVTAAQVPELPPPPPTPPSPAAVAMKQDGSTDYPLLPTPAPAGIEGVDADADAVASDQAMMQQQLDLNGMLDADDGDVDSGASAGLGAVFGALMNSNDMQEIPTMPDAIA